MKSYSMTLILYSGKYLKIVLLVVCFMIFFIQTIQLHAQTVNAKSHRGAVKTPTKLSPDGKQNIYTVSRDTTFYTAPLDEHGFVRYISAINADLAMGVTAENNSVPFYIAAAHPKADSPEHLEKLCRLLGIPVPALRTYTRSYEEILKNTAQTKFPAEQTEEQSAWEEQQYDLVFEKPWKAIDHPSAKSFLDQYQPTFNLLRQAAGKSGYWYPYVGGEDSNEQIPLFSILLPHVQEMRQHIRALRIKIMHDLGEENFQAARDDLIVARTIARHVGNGGTIIEQLNGIICRGIIFKAEMGFLNTCPDAKLLQDYKSAIEKLPKYLGMYDSIDKFERAVSLDIINTMARHDFGAITHMQFLGDLLSDGSFNSILFSMKFDWDTIALEINQSFDHLLAISKLERKARKLEFQAIDNEIKEYKNSLFQPDQILLNLMYNKVRSQSMAKVLNSLFMPGFSKVFDAEESAQMRDHIVELAIELNSYKLENGKYPAGLNQLIPKYLTQIPNDIFADAPLKYTTDGKTYSLYSIGTNEIDDGGNDNYDIISKIE